MTATPDHDTMTFRRHPRRAVQDLIVETTFPQLLPLTVAVIIGSGPVDYRTYTPAANLARKQQ